jgi:hypothetical protein
MRSFVALFLLLLQLGPMAGAVVCLHDVLARATAECPMGEQAHGATMATSVAPDEAGTAPADAAPGDCVLASFCLSTTPMTVQPALRIEFHGSQLRVALPAAEHPLVTLAGAPPFHPPIA